MYKFTSLFFLIAIISHVSQAQSGLVGYYSFCNCNANDNSGLGNHGILSGNPSCVPGQRGDGFLFNQNPGSNGCGQAGGEYVQLPPLGAIWGAGFTVCAWVRFDVVSYYERIIDFGNSSGDSGGMPIWFGREGSSNNLTLESWISSNATVNRSLGRLVAPNAITNGSIEYYCATISGDTMRIYVNGVLKAEKKGHPILNVPRSKNFIGRSNWCFADPDFKGFMDEVRIYNRALTEAEINSLYLQTPTFSSFQSPVFSGTPVQLQAQGGVAYQWSPAESLNDSTISNPIATPYDTTTYTCQVTLADGCIYTDSLNIAVLRMPTCSSICTGNLGENIFPNGDFGSGVPNILPADPGLAPGYMYTLNPPPNDGYYCISNNTTSWGSFAANAWIDIEDNGPEPNGYMMVVNASYQPGLFYQKTVDVCENTPYEFSIDVISLIFSAFPDKIRPNISFLIDGISVCETGDIAPDEQWHTARFSFISAPGQTTATLALRNNAPGGNGNDLAIDNISFRTCGPNVTVPPVVNFCNGVPATIHSMVTSSPYPNSVYLWQTFSNGTWEDVPNSNSDSIEILNPVDGSLFRLVVASAFPNLSMPNCRIVSETVLLKRLPDLLVNTTAQDVSCAGGSNATASAETFTGVAPYIYAWDSGESSSIIGNLSAGTYLVTVTDVLGCAGIASVIITEPPPLTTSIAATDVSCFGNQDGNAAVSVNGGVLPYSYAWSNGETDTSITNLITGNYLVSVTDANACAALASVMVTEPPLLTSNATATDVSCFGSNDGQAAVSVAGGVSPLGYMWSNGQSGASNTNLGAGTYQVTVTDAIGCTGIASVAVSEPPLLAASASATDVSCFGVNDAFASVSVSGGILPYSYTWSNGETNVSIANLSAGSYTVTVADANACKEIAFVMVTQPPLLSVSTTLSNVSCFGGNDAKAAATVSGGVPPYGYAWSNGQTNAANNNLSAGIYQVTLTDGIGCTGIASVTITEPPLLSATAVASQVSCFGGKDAFAAVSVSGGVLPYTYSWSNGQTSTGLTNIPAGTYLVTVTDKNACTTATMATVTEPQPLVASAVSTNIACFGGTEGTSIASVTGGVSPYTFVWNNAQTGAAASNLTAGMYAYTATDAKGCKVTGTTNIAQPPQLSINTSTVEVSCQGKADGLANAIVTGGVAPYTFIWSNGQTGILNQNLSAGTYTVTTTDNNGCSTVSSAAVNQPLAIQLIANANPVSCYGGADGAVATNISGGTSPYTYLWNNGATGSSHSNLTAGSYSVTATDAHGCTLTAQATVVQPSVLSSNASAEDVGCNGSSTGTVSVTVTGGTLPYHFHWNNGANTPQIANLPMGSYTLSITDAHGCLWTTTQQINEPPPLLLQTDKTNIRCFGDEDGELSATANGGVAPHKFLWSNGQTTADIGGLAAGVYIVSVTDANGCTESASEYLAEPIVQTVHLGIDLVLYLGDMVDLTANVNIPHSEVMDYTWSGSEDSLHCADCNTYRFQPIASGCQQVLVRSKKGCIALDTVCYKIRPHRRVYAPNVFTPNGDGTNDFFTIFSDDGVKQILSLKIFNRWGGQIYQTNHIKTNDEPLGWDGTFKGQDLNIDVFVWVAVIEFVDGEIIQLSGDVTLVR